MQRKHIFALFVLLAIACLAKPVSAADAPQLKFDTYSGYFVSNKFEPDAKQSFAVLTSQDEFDKVFGSAFVMRDKSHRLPKDAFRSLIVVAPIKRGMATWEFKVESVQNVNGVVELKYTATSKPSPTASFAVPLIVSIPAGDYKAIQFVENGKSVKKIDLAKK